MIAGRPQKPHPSFSEVDGIAHGDALVKQPKRQSQETGPRVPRGPVRLPEVLLVRVDGIGARQHREHGQVAEGAMELFRAGVTKQAHAKGWDIILGTTLVQ